MSSSINEEFENFKNKFSVENMENLLKKIINFGDDKINQLLDTISSSVTNKFQNMLDEDLLLIAMKQKLDKSKIDTLNELIESLINIVDNFFSPAFFRGILDGLKKEYEQLDFKDVTIFNMANIIGSLFQTMKQQIYNDLIQKALNENPKFEKIMDGIKLPDIFSNYLKKIFQDFILSLPIIIINMLVSSIPDPLPLYLIQLIENYGYKSIQTILFLLLNEAAIVVNTLDKSLDNLDNSLDKSLNNLDNSVGDKIGGEKRGKTQKQYYLNRIHNTIKNFNKTNKTRNRNR
jgi:hypothetical protein